MKNKKKLKKNINKIKKIIKVVKFIILAGTLIYTYVSIQTNKNINNIESFANETIIDISNQITDVKNIVCGNSEGELIELVCDNADKININESLQSIKTTGFNIINSYINKDIQP